MVTGLSMVSCKDGVCFGCVLRKHHWDNFDKHASWHASIPLELVHSDLCGPLPSASFFGFKYFLTFIDDYSRCTWVYFLNLKSEVFNMFLAYKALLTSNTLRSNLNIKFQICHSINFLNDIIYHNLHQHSSINILGVPSESLILNSEGTPNRS